MNMPRITIVVVCYNAIKTIKACFESLVRQTFRDDLYEIVFVDNQSTDGTLEWLHTNASRHANARVVVNPVRNIAKSRNIGLAEAQSPYVAYIDSDCTAPHNWLKRLAEGYRHYAETDAKLVGVGGANVPPPDQGRFYTTLNIFLNTFLGSHGSVQGKRFESDCYVPHLPTVNVLYRKKEIAALKFDEALGNIGEDQDLSFRLSKAGYRLLYLKDAAVVHFMRDSPGSWMQNMFVYGKGRARLILKHPRFVEPILFAPLLLVICLLAAVFGFLSVWPAVPFLLYCLFVFCYSIFAALKAGKPLYFANLFVIYVATHLSYGIGQGYGFLMHALNPCGHGSEKQYDGF
ncbi:MAG: glycosyltransferase [candidate division KSB1 bacterium]|nr:glycosyltransferase [candidate division KSB1 bacterium]